MSQDILMIDGKAYSGLQFSSLTTGSEERWVFGVGSIPVPILPSGQDMK